MRSFSVVSWYRYVSLPGRSQTYKIIEHARNILLVPARYTTPVVFTAIAMSSSSEEFPIQLRIEKCRAAQLKEPDEDRRVYTYGPQLRVWYDVIPMTVDMTFDQLCSILRARIEVQGQADSANWPTGRTPGTACGNLGIKWMGKWTAIHALNWATIRSLLEVWELAIGVYFFVIPSQPPSEKPVAQQKPPTQPSNIELSPPPYQEHTPRTP